jgi:hypothetical protein
MIDLIPKFERPIISADPRQPTPDFFGVSSCCKDGGYLGGVYQCCYG